MLICEISGPEVDFEAYLAIDSTVLGRCSGGVRMGPEVTLEETISLAKNMTLKYGFLKMPMGGAKLGIHVNKVPSGIGRRQIFVRIGESLEPLLIRGCFYPWVDMGTTWGDINVLRNAATHYSRKWPYFPTGEYASWTMLTSAEEALKIKGLELNQATVAVQGFGKVGSSAAKVFSEKGAKVVAVSTVNGAIYNPQGLEVPILLMYKEKFGDGFVNATPFEAAKICQEELLSLPVDILVLCAGSWQINAVNSHKIKAKIICPGANIAVTREAEEQLSSRNVIVLPDFISNCGGVLGSSVKKDSMTKRIIDVWFRGQVRQILNLSLDRGVAPSVIAEKVAFSRFEEMKAKHEGRLEQKIYQWLMDEIIPGIYRKVLMRIRSATRVKSNLK
jgi:glutamate dehydrogenase (NAD(P)+)